MLYVLPKKHIQPDCAISSIKFGVPAVHWKWMGWLLLQAVYLLLRNASAGRSLRHQNPIMETTDRAEKCPTLWREHCSREGRGRGSKFSCFYRCIEKSLSSISGFLDRRRLPDPRLLNDFHRWSTNNGGDPIKHRSTFPQPLDPTKQTSEISLSQLLGK